MKFIGAVALAVAAVAMLIAAVPVAEAASDPSLEVGSVMSSKGGVASVPIELDSNPGIFNMVIEVTYDAGLTLTGVENGSIFEMTYNNDYSKNPYTFMLESKNAADVKINGTVATLVFKVSPDATRDMTVTAIVKDSVNYKGDELVTENDDRFTYRAGTVALGTSVQSVQLSEKTRTLSVGETFRLEAVVLPAEAANKRVDWTSSSPAVATVYDGLVRAISPGTSRITVTTEDGARTDTCTVTVTTDKISVTGVSIDRESAAMKVGDTLTLEAVVSPSDATDKTVKWSSSNENVVIVTSSGKLTAVSAGTAVIKVTTNDGAKTDTCTVTVSSDPSPTPSGGGDNTLLYVGIVAAIVIVLLIALFVMKSRSR